LKKIIICEGKNDRNFLHGTITKILGINQNRVKSYSNIKFLIKDIRSNRDKCISISEGKGFPQCVKLAVRMQRQLWYKDNTLSVGIVTDSDIGSTYDVLKEYLTQYLSTPCKTHTTRIKINQDESEHKIEIIFERRSNINMWTLQVPENLEKQVSRVLITKYQQLKAYNDEDEIIKAASNILDISINKIICWSLDFFNEEAWFVQFCRKLDRYLNN